MFIILYYKYISSKVKGSTILSEPLWILEDYTPLLGMLFQPIYQETQKAAISKWDSKQEKSY